MDEYASEDVMTEIARLRAHLDTDHGIMVQLGIIADHALKMLEHVNMDTTEDRELHARAVSALRGRLDELAGKMKEMNEAARDAGATSRHGTLPEGFASSNASRSRQSGRRDAERARRALEMLGDTVSQRMREVAEARIADPEASWGGIGRKLGLTRDQASGLFRRLMERMHVAQLRDGVSCGDH